MTKIALVTGSGKRRVGFHIAEAQSARFESGEKSGEVVRLIRREWGAVDGVDGQGGVAHKVGALEFSEPADSFAA